MTTKDFRLAAFAGRRRELTALLEMGKALEAGRGAIVLIDGEYGVGKTRLIQQFLLEHGERTEAFAIGAMPLLLLGAWPADAQSVREVPRLDAAELDARRDRPTVLIFDDIGSTSKATLRLLERAASLSLMNPWLVVVAYENNCVDGARNGIARALLRLIGLGATEMPLEPLAAGDMQLLLQNAARASGVSAEHVEDIQRAARGNPMYAGELLRRAGGNAGARPLLSLADAMGRVAKLDDDAKDVLNAASVLGDRFDEAHVREMVKVPEDALGRILDRLVALRALEPEREKGAFKFSSGVDRIAIYEALLPAHRRMLHASAAEALLRSDAPNRMDLAWHAHTAQLPSSGTYIVQAAQAEHRRGRFGDTIRLLRAGLSAAHGDERREFVRALAKAMYLSSSGYNSMKPLLDELDAPDAVHSLDETAERYQRMLLGLVADCDGEGARRAAAEALRLPAGPSPALMELRMVVTRVLSMMDRTDEARAVLSTVPVPAPAEVESRARYYLALALSSRASDDHLECLEAFKAAIAGLWEKHPFGAAMSSATLATLLYQHGHLGEAWDALQHALEANRALGERKATTSSVVSITLTEMCVLRGDAQGARDALNRALASHEAGAFWRVDLAANALAVGAAMQDDLLVGAFDDESVVDDVLRSGLVDLIGLVTFGFCEVYAYRRQTAKLRALITRVLDATPAVDKCYFLAICAARYGAPGDVQRAKRLVAGSPWRMPFAKVHATLVRALVAARSGQRTEALRLSQRAWEGYEAAGWGAFAAIAHSVVSGKRGKTEASQPELTSREREIVRLAAEGLRDAEIAERLNLSPKTVGNHLTAAFAKLDVHSRRELKYRA